MNRFWLAALAAMTCALAMAPTARGEDEKPAADKSAEAAPAAEAKSESKEAATTEEPAPGHSLHAEVFNEGPRQKAYLMPGMPKIDFPATTKSIEAQAFINQGVGQLHGFWYFEAERSFRQAAALDPACGIAYWGMAMANIDNATRAKQFMEECLKHKTGLSEREVMYIDALDAYFKADAKKKKKERNEAYTKALEKLLYKYPQDIEARAFLALQLWKNRDSGSPITSYLAIDALIDQVFAVNPMHPAHHYRIHLWDLQRAENALESAARCGQTSPGIAHMWHMPGHIYSRLKRYEDACWQQEASARVDHAHMMRDRVLPDQIHNFAHNNEWLIRDMIHVGRVRDAIDLAKNMSELPRHPKYNTPTRGSSNYGRLRLYDALLKFEMWDEFIALSKTPYLDPTDSENEQLKRLRALGMAYYRSGNAEQGDAQLAELQTRLADQKTAQQQAMDEAEANAKEEKKPDGAIAKAKEQAKKKFDSQLNSLQKGIDELRGHQAVAKGDFKGGLELLRKAGGVDAGYLANVQFEAGDKEKAISALRSQASSAKGEVIPRARLVELLWRDGQKEEARKALIDLRETSGSIDLASPLFARIAPIGKELDFGDDWRLAKTVRSDTGNRPSLDSLGPIRWTPSPAIAWTLKDSTGASHSMADYRGKPVVVMFFLGHGCLHCAEQLQAFAKVAQDFRDAGLELVAISSDDQQGLKQSIENYGSGPIPIPLMADEALATFKDYRCYDDFEKQPLHGTFLVDGAGLVRWQDISYEPFMDAEFVIGEAQRLLGQSAAATAAPAATSAAGN
jgi:peroxiredoxin